ncbi:MAG: cation diffusion facilitator family transporter [Chloroflexota bacterium]
MHAHGTDVTSRRMLVALLVTLAFVILEAASGIFANSLALLTDAAHNVTDVVALGLTWYALRLTTRPANAGKTFGYHRAGILVALANSATLIAVALFIFYEAYQRLMSPTAVAAHVVIVVAAIAFVVNTGTAYLAHRGSDHDLNIRSAFIHLATDAVAILGTLLAGIGIALTHWDGLDAIASLLIGALILWSAWGIVRETLNILLESAPTDVDMGAMVRDLLRVHGVRGVHDLHVWSLSQNVRALSAHVLTDDVSISVGAAIQRDINRVLAEQYGIAHATLQLECIGCEPDFLYCGLGGTSNGHGHASQFLDKG